MNNSSTTDRGPPRIMFLVGAGISIPVGIPAMQGIYSDFLKKSKSDITDSELGTCRFLTETLKVEPDLEEFLLAANAICGFPDTALATFVEASVSTRLYGQRLEEYRSRAAERASEVDAVRTRILEYLARTCFEFERPKAEEIFGDFVEAISSAGYPIFSTNYDFALEHVAEEREIKVENNFRRQGRGQARRWVWDDSISFPTGEALTLIKLHGSVTWYQDDNGKIENISLDTNKNLAGRDVSRLLVFPTRFKDIYDQHFFALYSHFLSVLADAEVLIIAGHSLRDEYLRAGIIERHRKKGLQIVVIDPEFPKALPPELKPARTGGTGQIVHIPFPFEDIRDELTHLVKDCEPAEIAKRCSKIVRSIKLKSNKLAIRGDIRKLKAGDKKNFLARIEAKVLPKDKPARLRCWIQSAPNTQPRTTSEFLEVDKFMVERGASGLVKGDIPVEITVPEKRQWANDGKVVLMVGLIHGSVKRPGRLRKQAVIALDDREFSYSSE